VVAGIVDNQLAIGCMDRLRAGKYAGARPDAAADKVGLAEGEVGGHAVDERKIVESQYPVVARVGQVEAVSSSPPLSPPPPPQAARPKTKATIASRIINLGELFISYSFAKVCSGLFPTLHFNFTKLFETGNSAARQLP
jgi:hypothetical protein